MDRWRGRVALVTGASVGIGAGICRELVKQGMTVVGCARNVAKVEAISEEVKNSPGTLTAIKCDLSKESDILDMFQEIRRQFGRLDVCINNAGLSHNSPLLTGETSEWRQMLEVNVLALCICSKESIKLMREKGIDDGQIINISSIYGYQITTKYPGIHFYCGTKFMVRALTEGLRREVKELNSHIRIGSISPGFVETHFLHTFFKNDEEKIASVFGSLKCLQPKDIADAVVYILTTAPHVEVNDIIVEPIGQPHATKLKIV